MGPQEKRTPPLRVRLTAFEKTQLDELVELDEACAAQSLELGHAASVVPARSHEDLLALKRRCNIRVLEADEAVAGFVAWYRDSPGVAYLADVRVAPRFQRYGLGSALLDGLRGEARKQQLDQIVAHCWEGAPWAMGFFRRHRFMPIDPTAPSKVRGWKQERAAQGPPLVRPGEVVLWSPIGWAPKIDVDDEMDMTLLTGKAPGQE